MLLVTDADLTTALTPEEETDMLRRRPLMRAAATTAVVAGTATAVSGRGAHRQQASAQPAADQAAAQQQPAPEPPAMPALTLPSSGLTVDAMEQLKELAALHEQSVLTDEEFAAEKAKILA